MQNDIESLVSGIKQLNALLVVTIPDCLLVSSWRREGQNWDTEAAGSLLGQLVHSTEQGGQAINGWTAGLAAITLESDSGLIILRQVKEPFAVAYVFGHGTAIGWARLQVQRTLQSVAGRLDGEAPPPSAKPVVKPDPFGAGAGGAKELGRGRGPLGHEKPDPFTAAAASAQPHRSPGRAVRAPAKPFAAKPASVQAGSTPGQGGAASRPASAPTPMQAVPAPKPAAAPAPTPAAVKPAPAPAPKPAPAPAPAPKPAAAPAPKPASAPQAVKPGDQKSPSSSSDQDATPKGTRLLKYLDTHAPDTHAALLRVSLQTGLPLTLLRMPDSLSDDEFAQVEESVRRILGVDQLTF